MQNVYDEILNYFGNEIAYVDTTSVLSLYKQQKIVIDHKDFCCLYQLIMYRKSYGTITNKLKDFIS